MSSSDKLDMARLEQDLRDADAMTPSIVIYSCLDDTFQGNIKYLEDSKCNVARLKITLRTQIDDANESASMFGILGELPPSRDMQLLLSFINDFVGKEKAAPTFEDIVDFVTKTNSAKNDAFAEVMFALKSSGYNPVLAIANNKYKTINKYCTDLVLKAKNNKLDPLIGRESEVERIIEILAHYKKKNPLLVGDAGTGKTAIVEGLASAIAQDKVPDAIKGAKIYSTSIAQLMAGTKFRGDVEEKVGLLVEELKRHEQETGKPTYLFIDELHQMVGAGGSGGDKDGSNIANILKPDLASGELSLIGATTGKEYKRTIQKDDALNRRLQVVRIEPPSDAQTIEILRKGVSPVLSAYHGVKFSKSVIEASVRLSSKYITDKAQPDNAISILDSIGARLRTTEHRDIARVSDVEKLISVITGTPVSAFKQKVGKEEYIDIEGKLNAVVFGQTEAVKKIAEIYDRSKAGLNEAGQPIGSILAIGPTGVGKTEVAKSLAEVTQSHFMKINMGEYTEEHAVAKLFGAPPGYVGHNEGGLLTNEIRKNPHSIILLDEIEKAHTKVYEALLGIIDGAKMVDGEGNSVDFSNTLIIMTSNVGAASAAARKVINLGGNVSVEVAKAQVSMAALKATFSPEFRNKLTATVSFNALGEAEIRNVTDKFLKKAQQTLKDKKGIEVEFTEEVYAWISKNGFSTEFGARPTKKLIDIKIIDALVKPILMGIIPSGSKLSFDVLDDDVVYSLKEVVTP
jgi:ATP-dependent Clp protease ATP-binding subunit ClpA